MGGFYLVRRGDGAEAAVQRIEGSFRAQGFAEPERIATEDASIGVYPKLGPSLGATGPSGHRGADGTFAVAAGTLIYRSRTGAAALERLLADAARGALDRSELFGHYAVVLDAGRGLVLFNDPLGTYPVWQDSGRRVMTSSFLAAAAVLERPTVDVQACYEYVFQGAVYGGASLFQELGLLDCHAEHVMNGAVRPEPRPLARPAAPADAPIEAHVARNLANLRRYYDAIVAAFGDGIDTALSGGYDSRLTLALLLERGNRPAVHVYGRADDADVAVARAIAAGEGIALEHVDKSGRPPLAPEAFAEVVERNFLAFHGHPVDGLFENGTDLDTRLARCGPGRLMLNGGGGEIFRNFFYLPDRAYAPRELLWAFYSRFDPRACTAVFDEEAYYRALETKLLSTLGLEAGPLERIAVERVYPEFRCRFWMGNNNSVNNRLGAALTPFIDANVVSDALSVPIALKDHGRLEARMIHAVSPRLAAYPSAYGHSLDRDPPLMRRLKDRTTYARPPWLRRYAFRLKTRHEQSRPYWLSGAYLSRVVDLRFPYLGALFNVASVHDVGQFNRLCTLEYLFAKVAPELEARPMAAA